MTFEWPLMLFGFGLLPLLAAAYWLAQRRRRAYALRFTNLELLRSVAGPRPGLRRHIPPLIFLCGLAALLLSLARPNAVIAVPRDQAAVMLVLDISGSMTADDMSPNRMESARAAALAFVDSLPEDAQLGLVSFSSQAALRAPLSHDRVQAERAIRELQPGGGTAIGDGLSLALDQIASLAPGADGTAPPARVVLLSDGESEAGAPPTEAAARARAEGVQVDTVGIGQRGQVTYVGDQPVRLDEATLQAIAQQTGGSYYYAAEGQELERIYENLGSQIAWVEEHTEVTAAVAGFATLLMLLAGLLSLRWFQQLP
jgi:Ca-activated chloride channel family protein